MSLVNPCGKRDINPFKDNSRAVFWIVIVGKAFGFYMEERVPGFNYTLLLNFKDKRCT